ncbi:hypothetical protein [Bacillus sp. FJAT-27225]|uniref:hypothetical protein n=1 Tax=Bacillus sp. FJAT-27225 TaxID=1743144 RepID=UPI001585EDD4|nr:hypothetical protein [Bacillus sp. FJAT-27225]
MPNRDKGKFQHIQEKHQGEYIGTDRDQPRGKYSGDYNGQGNTDKSPGAVGRKV